MSNDVVNGPKPVVRATAVAAQQRVAAVALVALVVISSTLRVLAERTNSSSES